MSVWTHICGSVEIDVHGVSQSHIQYVVETILNHLPVVSGSECNMQVHIIKKYGHNVSSSFDDFGNIIIRNNNTDDDDCYNNFQTKYILVLEGDLRDREFEETKRSFMKWLIRLAKRAYIIDILVKVWSYDQKMVIDNVDSFLDITDDPWINKLPHF